MRYVSIIAFTFLFSTMANNAFAADDGLAWGNFSLRLLNFAIFLWLIWHFAGKKIMGFLINHRSDAIKNLDDAAKLKNDAGKQLAQAEQKLLYIQDECDKLIAEGKAQAEAIKQRIIADATKQAEKIIENAKHAAIQEAIQEKAKIQAELADDIITKLEKDISSRLNKGEHLKLVEKSLTKVVLS